MKHNSNRWPALLDKDGPECPKRPYQKSSNFRQGATLMDILQLILHLKKVCYQVDVFFFHLRQAMGVDI